MPKPNFFIVGFPKCGTTTLYEMLQGHPSIFMPERKEPYFFTPGRRRKVATMEEYLALFAPATEKQKMIGEGSTDTVYTPGALEAVKEFAPDAKIIVMLRDPVQLVRSLHSYLCYLGTEDVPDLDAAWDLQEERAAGKHVPPANNHPLQLQYGHVGKMGEHVQRLFSLFPREHVLVLFLEDLGKDSAGVYARTLEFLGVESDGRTTFERANVNDLQGSAARMHGRIHQPLVAVRRKLKGLDRWIKSESGQKLHGILLKALGAGKSKTAGKDARAIDPLTEQKLREFFNEDVALLESLTGRDLSNWQPRSINAD